MIDASSKPFAENIEITKKVVEYAHDHGVVVEAELGALAGIEDDVKVSAEESHYTHPEEVEEFVAKTGCDSLAIAIGTSHGAYKFTAAQCTRNEKGELVPPPLRFDILDEVVKRLPGFPIVLHGSSSVPQEFVRMVNEFGGKMPDAVGIPEEQLRKAARSAVCKINIDSDLRLAMTGTIRKFMAEHPDKFDPREYLKPARAGHQGAGVPQDRGRAGLRPQGLSLPRTLFLKRRRRERDALPPFFCPGSATVYQRRPSPPPAPAPVGRRPPWYNPPLSPRVGSPD